jgi:hypothetical protein
MLNFLSSPAWQGIGVIATIVIGFIGFYYAGKNKLWLYVSGGTVLFLLGLISATIVQSAQVLNLAPLAFVSASSGWQDTGLEVKKGDKVTLKVVGGVWTVGRKKLPDEISQQLMDIAKKDRKYSDFQYGGFWQYLYPETTGDGYGTSDKCFTCPAGDASHGSLVARIGNSEPFGIGNEKTFSADSDGTLFLSINDGRNDKKGLEDNAGGLAVKLQIGKN